MNIRVNPELRKDRRILEWLENWAIEFLGEVYLSLRSIVKPDPYDEVSDQPGIGNSDHHGLAPQRA
jgi:hypothetical protein